MRKNWRELIVMLMCGYLGLGFPDVDHLLLPVLHHRSIITHSIILPAIFLLIFKNTAMRFGACGFILGVSVHLSADVLSRPIGFGAIWLPWPIKYTLGPLSPLWIAANAIVGLVWVKVLFFKLEQRAPLIIFILAALVLGPSYALVHERSLTPLVSFAIVFSFSLTVSGWITRQAWFKNWLPQKVALPPSSHNPS